MMVPIAMLDVLGLHNLPDTQIIPKMIHPPLRFTLFYASRALEAAQSHSV